MESPDILSQLTLIFQNFLDEDDLVLKRETTADDIEEWTSLNHLQLIVCIENHFDFKFNHKDISNLSDIGNLIDLISSKL